MQYMRYLLNNKLVVRRELTTFIRDYNQFNSSLVKNIAGVDKIKLEKWQLTKRDRRFNFSSNTNESKFASIPPITRNSNIGKIEKMGSNDEKRVVKLTGREFIIWVDCEMSGLDVDKEVILEIAVIITDAQLNEIARHEEIIINAGDSVLNAMDAWCLKHHGDSGLTEASRKSKITLQDADTMLVDFVVKHTDAGICPLAGNSIFLDRVFITKYLPKFGSHLHYRNIDVSTIKELSRRWYPKEFFKAPKKRFAHRTLSDIEESIEELRYYRSAIFKPSSENENTKK